MVVEYYETTNGKYPVEEFIQKQDKKMIAKILRVIMLLESMGAH